MSLVSAKRQNGDGESSAEEIVMNNEDLLAEIVVRLPPKSLLGCWRFVSKSFHSLISSPEFRHRHTLLYSKNPTKVVAILSAKYRKDNRIRFTHVYGYDSLILKEEEDDNVGVLSWCPGFLPSNRTRIRHSCNGLLLLQLWKYPRPEALQMMFVYRYLHTITYNDLYVCNPTTRRLRKLPSVPVEPSNTDLINVGLYFEPSVSSHYKVICFRIPYSDHNNTNNNRANRNGYPLEIEIYSSETRNWKHTSCAFDYDQFNRSSDFISWNGSINWLACYDKLYSVHSLDVIHTPHHLRKVLLHRQPSPWRQIRNNTGRCLWMHLEVSEGHLSFFEIRTKGFPLFEVLGLHRDYSGWSVRHRVDLSQVCSLVPETVWEDDTFNVVCLFEGLFWIQFPGKVVAFDVKHSTVEKVYNFLDPRDKIRRFTSTFHLINSLACV